MSFNPDGFTVNNTLNGSDDNLSTKTAAILLLGHGELAGLLFPNDGTITSQVSANTDYGFSIVSSQVELQMTIGHGLGQTPKFYIVKARENTAYTDFWNVYHTSTWRNAYIKLNQTAGGKTTGSTIWNAPRQHQVFSVDATSIANENNTDYVAYVWSEVSGF